MVTAAPFCVKADVTMAPWFWFGSLSVRINSHRGAQPKEKLTGFINPTTPTIDNQLIVAALLASNIFILLAL